MFFQEDYKCIDQIFTFILIIEKCLSHEPPLVLSFMDYEQAFDSADRRAWAKVLSLYDYMKKTSFFNWK